MLTRQKRRKKRKWKEAVAIMLQNWPTRDWSWLSEIRLEAGLCRLRWSEPISRYDLRTLSSLPCSNEREEKKKGLAIRHCLADASRRIVCKCDISPFPRPSRSISSTLIARSKKTLSFSFPFIAISKGKEKTEMYDCIYAEREREREREENR